MAQSIWDAGLLLPSLETYGEDPRVLSELAVLVTAFWELAVRFRRVFVAQVRVPSEISVMVGVSWELVSYSRLDVRSYGLQIVEHARALGHGLGDHAPTPAPDRVPASSRASTVPEAAQRSYATSWSSLLLPFLLQPMYSTPIARDAGPYDDGAPLAFARLSVAR